MEATTYSPMVYLKWQTKEQRDVNGNQFYDIHKEWHIKDLFEYWQSLNIK